MPATAKPKPQQYRVLNPRGIQAGVPVLAYRNRSGQVWSWCEGEVFTLPEGFDADGRLLRDGFYEEVT